jgi:hypothetical protein
VCRWILVTWLLGATVRAFCTSNFLESLLNGPTRPVGSVGLICGVLMLFSGRWSRLGEYPSYGRVGSWDNRDLLRGRPVAGTPLVVVYEVNETIGAVTVLRVVHGAQRRG